VCVQSLGSSEKASPADLRRWTQHIVSTQVNDHLGAISNINEVLIGGEGI
jgi:hypothetical protein